MKWHRAVIVCIVSLIILQFLSVNFFAFAPRWNRVYSLIRVEPYFSGEESFKTLNSTRKPSAEIAKLEDDEHIDVHTGMSLSGYNVSSKVRNSTGYVATSAKPISNAGTEYPTLEDCFCIINGSLNGRNVTGLSLPDVTNDEEVLHTLEKGCDEFMARYDFMSKAEQILYSTRDELEFAIAYTILVHKNLHQIATLLSAIFRNQNVYCIHVDTKSSEPFQRGVRLMAKCFPNVFEATKKERVVYASFSRLKAEVNCMQDLLSVPTTMYNWKHLINLCGQDFPVSTNLEIVNQLKSMKGRNCFSGTRELNDIAVRRVKYVHELINITAGNQTSEMVRETRKLLDPPPYNLTTVKNMAYAIFTREFLQWALVDSEEGSALFNWSSYTRTPDEHFWGTLHVYPKAPGWSKSMSWRGVARAILWKSTEAEEKCRGYWQHNSCVFGSGGLWWLTKVEQAFANKFDVSYDSTPVRCLRKLLDERTKGNASKRNRNKQPMSL